MESLWDHQEIFWPAMLVAWLICIIVAGVIGSKKGETFGSLIISMLLGPLGLLMVYFSAGSLKTCPYCKQEIKLKAIVCPKCDREL